MSRTSRLSERERAEIIDAYRKGGSAKAIARQYGIARTYVIMLDKRDRNPPKPPKARPTSIEPKPIRISARPREPRTNAPKIILPKQVGSGRSCVAGYLKLM